MLASAKSLFSRVTGGAAAPPEQRDTEAALKAAEAELETLLREWKHYESAALAAVSAGRRANQRVAEFLARSSADEEEFAVFVASQEHLLRSEEAAARATISPFVRQLETLSGAPLRNARARKKAVREAHARRCAARERLAGAGKKQGRDDIGQLQMQWSRSVKEYDAALFEFTGAYSSLRAQQNTALLGAMCGAMEAQAQSLAEGQQYAVSALGGLEDLRRTVQDQALADADALAQYRIEAKQMRELSAMTSDIRDPRLFRSFLSAFEGGGQGGGQGGPALLGGEGAVGRAERVLKLQGSLVVPGSVVVTNFRWVFTPYRPAPGAAPDGLPAWFAGAAERIARCRAVHVPLKGVSRMQQSSDDEGGTAAAAGQVTLTLSTQQLETHSFLFHDGGAARQLFDSVQAFVWESPSTFAYYYKPAAAPPAGAWSSHFCDEAAMRAEFARMGVPGSGWALTAANAAYELSPTYPSVLAVPAAAPPALLSGTAAFRSKARLPILSYRHAPAGSCLFRCSQPLVGLMRSKRSDADEAYLSLLRRNGSRGGRLTILDARPKLNAVANGAKGGGYESTENYSGCDFAFLKIENIHVVRESMQSLRGAFLTLPAVQHGGGGDRFAGIAAALRDASTVKWFWHLETVLAGGARAARLLLDGVAVVVHCSDGWDRTSQITALAKLMIDPYYRTFDGFFTLVQAEFVAAGHKFARRHGLEAEHRAQHNDKQRSCVFAQFLDAVYQLLSRRPSAFEFLPGLLVELVDELHACRYGTFLHDSERERAAARVRDKTLPVWVAWAPGTARRRAHTNAEFVAEAAPLLVGEEFRAAGMHLFRDMYARWDVHVPAPPTGAFVDPDSAAGAGRRAGGVYPSLGGGAPAAAAAAADAPPRRAPPPLPPVSQQQQQQQQQQSYALPPPLPSAAAAAAAGRRRGPPPPPPPPRS